MKHLHLAALAASLAAGTAMAQNRVDLVRPDAPELAAFGDRPVGVRSMDLTVPARVDIAASSASGQPVEAPRSLQAEIWYPADPNTETEPGGRYSTLLRDGATEVTLTGRATRDAAPAEGQFPLVILSHGYPGNRMLMLPLAENLASKGYVVVSADHPDSTYQDMGVFTSTLVNRPADQRFLLDAMAGLTDGIGAIADTDRAAVIGYSMGGYGALIFGGAGLSQTAVTRSAPEGLVPPADLLGRLAAGGTDHAALIDPRVRAVIAIAPWGRQHDFWDAEGLARLKKPLMLVAGSDDDVSVYDAIRDIFAETIGTTRHLLTFEYANHNAAAPMPAPAEAWQATENGGAAPFDHYADPVWDSVRMNNIMQHFATAFLDLHLKDDAAAADYLDLVPDAGDGVWSLDDSGQPDPAHSYWKGFPERTAKGLSFETRAAGQ